MFYDNFRAACAKRGTSITNALKAIGRSTSATGGWSRGSYPGLDICIELADYLGVSLDELVYGPGDGQRTEAQLSASEREWLDIISCIPVDRQETCKDFLRTHMVEPKKYSDKRNA